MHCGTAMGRAVTSVGSDGFFMVGVHIGHDCVVGDNVIMANTATLGGHVEVADHVIMGGLSAVHQYTRIGRHAFVGGMAGVNHDVIPFGNVWGNHAHLEGLNLVGLKINKKEANDGQKNLNKNNRIESLQSFSFANSGKLLFCNWLSN